MSTMNTDLESAIDRAIKRRRAADAGASAPSEFESRVSDSIARVRRQKIGYVAGGPGGIPGAKEGAAPVQAPDPWAFGAPDFTPPTSELDPQTIRSMLEFKQQVKAMGGNIDGKSDAEVMALMQSYAQNGGNTIGAHNEQTTAIDEFSRGLRRGVAYGLPAGLEFVREMRENEQVQRAPEGMAGFAGETLGGFAGLLDPGKAPQNAAAIWLTGGLGKIAQPVIGRIASVAGNRVANAVSEAILNAGQGGGMAALEEAGKIPVEEWQRDWQGSLARIGKAAGVGSVAAGGLGAAFGSMRAGTPHQYAPTLPERVAPDAGAPMAEQRQINLAQQAAADAARTVADGQTAMRDVAQAFNRGTRIVDPNAPDSAIVPDQGGWQGDPLARQTFQQINETRSPEATLAAAREAEIRAQEQARASVAALQAQEAAAKQSQAIQEIVASGRSEDALGAILARDAEIAPARGQETPSATRTSGAAAPAEPSPLPPVESMTRDALAAEARTRGVLPKGAPKKSDLAPLVQQARDRFERERIARRAAMEAEAQLRGEQIQSASDQAAASTENPLAELLARRNTTPDTAREATPNAPTKEFTNGQEGQGSQEWLLSPGKRASSKTGPSGIASQAVDSISYDELVRRAKAAGVYRDGPKTRAALVERVSAAETRSAQGTPTPESPESASARMGNGAAPAKETPSVATSQPSRPATADVGSGSSVQRSASPNPTRQPWEMTRDEWNAKLSPTARATFGEFQHRNFVLNALASDEPVPSHVVAEYPGIEAKAQEVKAAAIESDRRTEANRAAQYAKEEQRKNAANAAYQANVDRNIEALNQHDAYLRDEAWKKTKSEYVTYKRGGARQLQEGEHRESVETALREGRPVPPEVLKDYPDLAARAKPPTPAEAGTTPAGTEAARVEAPKASKQTTTITQRFNEKTGKMEDAPIEEAASISAGPAMPAGRTIASRIAPDPITGKRPKPIAQILSDAETNLGLEVRRGGQSRGALGTYFPSSQRTSIRRANDLDTAIHEIAHRLDDEYGIVGPWSVSGQHSPYDGELLRPELQQTIKKTYSLSQRRAEGVAEWVRAWTMNPAQAEAIAPKFADWFKKTVPADAMRALRTFSDDVRTLAGASGVDKIASNVQFEPPGKGTIKAAKDFVLGDTSREFRYTLKDRLGTALADELTPVFKGVDFVRQMQGIDFVPPSRDARKLMSVWRGFDSKSEQVLMHGPITADGKHVPGMGGIDWLVEPMKGATTEEVKANQRTVAAYMISERIVEKGSQLIQAAQDRIAALPKTAPARLRASIMGAAVDRAGRLFSATGGIESDMAVAGAAMRELAADPAKLTMAREAAKRYRQWGTSVLQYMVDKGRITQDAMDRITQSNEFYVSFKRLTESLSGELYGGRGGGRAVGSKRETIGRFKGGTETVQDPWVSLMENTHAMMREADRNEALRAFTEELKRARGMYRGEAVDFDQIGSMGATKADESIPVFVNGKQENWNFNPAIYKALKNWGGDIPSVPVISTLTRAFTHMVTKWTGFIVRNPIRDSMTRTVVSDSGSTPWASLYYLAHPSEFKADVNSMKLAGGGFFPDIRPSQKDYYGALSEAMKKVAADRSVILTTPKKLLDGLGKLTNASEHAGRLAEWRAAFKKAKDAGMSDLDATIEAAHQSRSLLDFARAGRAMRWVNQFIPFSNASMQGMLKVMSTAIKHPARTGARAAMYLVAPIALERLYNSFVGSEEERKQLPAWQHDFFFNFRIGDSWLSIPKPYDLGVLASAFDRGWDRVEGDKEAFKGYGGSLAKGLMPVQVDDVISPGMFGVGVELAANRDMFRDAPIVPPWEEDKDLSLREGQKSASRIGKTLGELIGVDARYVDHFIRGVAGSWGSTALNASDVGREDKPNAGKSILMSMSGLLRPDAGPNQRDFRSALDEMRRRGMENTTTYRRMANLATRFKLSKDENERRQLSAQMREVGSDMLAQLRNTEIGQTRTARRK